MTDIDITEDSAAGTGFAAVLVVVITVGTGLAVSVAAIVNHFFISWGLA